MSQHNHKLDTKKKEARPVKDAWKGVTPNVGDSVMMRNARKQTEIKPKGIGSTSFQGVAPKIKTDTFMVSHAKRVPKASTENIAREVCIQLRQRAGQKRWGLLRAWVRDQGRAPVTGVLACGSLKLMSVYLRGEAALVAPPPPPPPPLRELCCG